MDVLIRRGQTGQSPGAEGQQEMSGNADVVSCLELSAAKLSVGRLPLGNRRDVLQNGCLRTPVDPQTNYDEVLESAIGGGRYERQVSVPMLRLSHHERTTAGDV